MIAFFIARQKMCNEDLLLIEKLRKYFLYSESEGVLYWNVSKPPVRKGTAISNLNSSGYVSMKVDGKHFYAHRAIWAIYYGEFPKGQIDHINRVRTDNRLCNLRDVSQTENQLNCGMRKDNSSGFKGVSFMPKYNKWRAYIRVDKKLKHLGCYVSAELADAAYKNALATFYPQLVGENNE